jgi:hypothetical protein
VLEAIQADKPGFRFMGTDVACSQIDKHKATFADRGSWAFQCVDYANEPLPGGYELVFSRDSLQHIPLHGVWQFLNNVKASGAKYLLVRARRAAGRGAAAAGRSRGGSLGCTRPRGAARVRLAPPRDGGHRPGHDSCRIAAPLRRWAAT